MSGKLKKYKHRDAPHGGKLFDVGVVYGAEGQASRHADGQAPVRVYGKTS